MSARTCQNAQFGARLAWQISGMAVVREPALGRGSCGDLARVPVTAVQRTLPGLVL
jgi:hypothetical protein